MIFSDSSILDKNIFIISHPRSGGTWLRKGFSKHYNLSELFNNLQSIKIDKTQIIQNKPDLTKNVNDPIIERIMIYNALSKVEKTAVGVHTYSLTNKELLNFVTKESKDIDKNFFIFLERQNKLNVFMSFLIAYKTNNWFKQKNQEEESLINNLTIEPEKVYKVLTMLEKFEQDKDYFKKLFNATPLYYEDLLNEPESEIWSPNKPDITIQNEKSKIKIDNYEEIINLIKNSDFKVKEEILRHL